MGSRDRWSSGLDVVDVDVSWRAMEQINQVTISVMVNSVPRGAIHELQLHAIATPLPRQGGDPSSWELASAICWVFDYQNLETALFRLLYMLDGAIAEHEIGRSPENA